jgi:hypothetical protein
MSVFSVTTRKSFGFILKRPETSTGVMEEKVAFYQN